MITASILSYNAATVLPRVIEGVEEQSHVPDRIVIVDNGSTDGTIEYLNSLPAKYEVVLLDDNRGVGAGHNEGWRVALENPACTHIWALENDSIPPPDCLSKLASTASQLASESTPFGALVPTQVHPDEESTFEETVDPEPLSTMTFNGVLIPAEVIRRVGYIREDFFVDQEDREFGLRLLDAGLPMLADPSATVFHLGKGKRRREEPSVFRTYYRVRNSTYLQKHVKKQPLSATRSLIRTAGAIVRALTSENKKSARIKARSFGVIDGLRGNLGKQSYKFLSN